MSRIRFSDVIDISASASAPVAAWTIVGQALNKPWAINGFIILWRISFVMWIIKKIMQIKKKNARRQPKHSSRNRNKFSNNSISEKRRKNNSMLEKYFCRNAPWLREVRGSTTIYKKRDL